MPDKSVQRIGDMHPKRTLVVTVQKDGDAILRITENGSTIESEEEGCDGPMLAYIEFCANGGRSHRVRRALYRLFFAIQKENEEHPISLPDE